MTSTAPHVGHRPRLPALSSETCSRVLQESQLNEIMDSIPFWAMGQPRPLRPPQCMWHGREVKALRWPGWTGPRPRRTLARAMADKPIVIVTEPLDEPSLAYLAEHAEVRAIPIDQLDAHIAVAAGLVVRTYTLVTPDLLDRAPNLKVVGRAGVALDNIDVPAARARGVEVVHTPAANTLAVVDYTLRMILEMNRRFWPMDGPVSEADFLATRKNRFGRFLADMTLGIVGVGRIGSRVGRAAAALGMTVLTNDIRDVTLDYPHQAVDKPALYAGSDVVTLHVPLTDLTRGLIDADALAMFKRGAQLINAARGACVVAADLADAVRSGRISAAAIDCHEPEPPPADYPLFGLDHVILTPHIAARVPAAMAAMCQVVRDVVEVIEGRPPQYPAAEGSY